MRTRTRSFPVVAAAATALALGLSACGSGESASSSGPAEVVEVTMVDNAFEPERLQVAAGESITFRFRNEGNLDHEAYLGTVEEQEQHSRDMAGGEMDMAGDDMGHDDEGGHGGGHDDGKDGGHGAVTVAAGETEELTVTFDDAAELEIGCHVPGHYESGMKASLTVA